MAWRRGAPAPSGAGLQVTPAFVANNSIMLFIPMAGRAAPHLGKTNSNNSNNKTLLTVVTQ